MLADMDRSTTAVPAPLAERWLADLATGEEAFLTAIEAVSPWHSEVGECGEPCEAVSVAAVFGLALIGEVRRLRAQLDEHRVVNPPLRWPSVPVTLVRTAPVS